METPVLSACFESSLNPSAPSMPANGRQRRKDGATFTTDACCEMATPGLLNHSKVACRQPAESRAANAERSVMMACAACMMTEFAEAVIPDRLAF